MRSVSAFNKNKDSYALYADDAPDKCPRCKRNIVPKEHYNVFMGEHPGGMIQTVFQCTNDSCSELFIASYVQDVYRGGPVPTHSKEYHLTKIEPETKEKQKFSDEINKVSADFSIIYNQALSAESFGLNDICGAGYRKSLEYLIKDYLINIMSLKEEEIRNKFLSKCIIDDIDDNRLKICAEKAAWLGNDESHYYRKWENKDISDLKILIKLSVNWIESLILTERYDSEMTQ